MPVNSFHSGRVGRFATDLSAVPLAGYGFGQGTSCTKLTSKATYHYRAMTSSEIVQSKEQGDSTRTQALALIVFLGGFDKYLDNSKGKHHMEEDDLFLRAAFFMVALLLQDDLT